MPVTSRTVRALGALSLLLGACSPAATPAAPTPNLEATVQTRVTATVQAAAGSAPVPAAVPSPASKPTVAPAAAPKPKPKPTAAPVGQEIVVEKVLFAPRGSDKRYITAAALVRNPNPDLWMPTESYTATAFDAAGMVLGTDENVIGLGAGEERWVVVMQMTAPGEVSRVEFQLRRRRPFQPAATDPAPKMTVVQSNLQGSGPSAVQVGQVKNEGTVPVQMARVDVVYFDAAGALIGTGSAHPSDVGPGQTVSFRTLFGPNSTPADTKTYVTPELLRT